MGAWLIPQQLPAHRIKIAQFNGHDTARRIHMCDKAPSSLTEAIDACARSAKLKLRITSLPKAGCDVLEGVYITHYIALPIQATSKLGRNHHKCALL